MATPQSFTVDVQRFVAGSKDKLRRFAIEFVQDVAEAVVEATPVKTGFMRASWWANIGSTGGGPNDGTGVATLGVVAGQLQLGDVYHMNNGTAYAMRVEFGFVGTDSLGRHYNQAPRAFVRGTLATADSFAEAAAAKIAAQPTS